MKLVSWVFPILIYTGLFCLWGDPQQFAVAGEKMQMIGHRGAAGLAPENTLAAFRKALELMVDGIEMDVLLTADGEIMVHHNFALNPDIARIEGDLRLSAAKTMSRSIRDSHGMERF